MHATCFEWYLASWQKLCPLALTTYPSLSGILRIHAGDELRATRLYCLLYCENLNDAAKRGREKLSGYRAFIHCHIRISVLFTYAKKGDYAPILWLFILGTCVCACECAAQIRVG